MQASFGKNAAVFFALVSAVFLIQGCGVKAPPVAPGPDPLPAVSDLRLTRGPGGIWLTWSMPRTPAVDPSGLAAFVIYRSKTDAAGCKDCPVLFVRLARVPVENRGGSDKGAATFVFEDRLQHGFNYSYKVNLVDREGREGPDSNRVEVAFLRDR